MNPNTVRGGRRHQEQRMKKQDTTNDQPQPELVADDDQLVQENARLKAEQEALKQRLAELEAAAQRAADPEVSEPEEPEPETTSGPGIDLETILKMAMTPEGIKAILATVADKLEGVSLDVAKDGINATLRGKSHSFHASAWMDENCGVDRNSDASRKTTPLWGKGSVDYSDCF